MQAYWSTSQAAGHFAERVKNTTSVIGPSVDPDRNRFEHASSVRRLQYNPWITLVISLPQFHVCLASPIPTLLGITSKLEVAYDTSAASTRCAQGSSCRRVRGVHYGMFSFRQVMGLIMPGFPISLQNNCETNSRSKTARLQFLYYHLVRDGC